MRSLAPPNSRETSTRAYREIAVILGALGCIAHSIAYESLAPIVVAAGIYFFGELLLWIPKLGGELERIGYRMVFSTCYFMAGLAALYANILQDEYQLYFDAGSFYMASAHLSHGLSLEDIGLTTTGEGAVYIWREIYDFFEQLGFEKERYIGITTNVWLVAMTVVVGIKTCRTIPGCDAARIKRFSLIFSLCGTFWLFAALHLRDAFGLFVVSALVLLWARYLCSATWINLTLVIAFSLIGVVALKFVRNEFAYLPGVMLFAAVVSILLFGRGNRSLTRASPYLVALTGVVLVVLLFSEFQTDIAQNSLDRFYGYADFSRSEHDADSLGTRYIINAPFLVRLVLGFGYLFIFPIPIWSGFQLESAYFLFKAAGGLFSYAFLPLLGVALLRIAQLKSLRSPVVMFLAIFAMSMTFSVSATSIETRHLGAFLVPLIVIAAMPDLSQRKEKSTYAFFSLFFFGLVLAIHIAWALLKFSSS